jgi:predicted RNA-binding Zn ribbon-like protein
MIDFRRSKVDPRMSSSKPTENRSSRFELIAGAVCLDFVNTLDDRPSRPKELLKSYSDFLDFCRDAELISRRQAEQLAVPGHQLPRAANHALSLAIEMREAMYGVFEAVARNLPIPRSALDQLNEHIQNASRHMRLAPAKGHFVWEFESTDADNPFEAVLWPIARSAADLLASDQLPFVRMCSSETCQWFFLDSTKNHRRRWCDMTKCGNRDKVRRFYARKKHLSA